MTRAIPITLTLALGLTLAATLPRSALAEDKARPADEAQVLFRKGVELYKAGDFKAAESAFKRAYEVKPSFKLWFNIGQAEAAAGRYDLAIQSFEKYLVEGKDEINEERRDEVLAEITKCRSLVGFVEIAAPDGAAVMIDGEDRGRTPLRGKLMVTVGQVHKVEVRLGEELLVGKEIEVTGGMVERIEAARQTQVSPVAEPPPAQPAEQPAEAPAPLAAEPSDRGSSLRTWGWATLGAGAAIAVAGGIVGGVALGQDDHLYVYCPDAKCAPERAAEVDALESMALAADILIGVGAAAALAGAVMLLVPKGKGADEEKSARVGGAVTPAGAVIELRF